MNNNKILAGLDLGHVNTKAVIMRGREILGYTTVPTGFDIAGAAENALKSTLKDTGILRNELDGIVATGIFRDVAKSSSLNVTPVPEYVSDAKGALFFNKNSRTVIDMGGNIHKAIHYDKTGNILDVIENDKCADGMGIFYTNMATILGTNEQGLSELALKSTKKVSVAIHCSISAESEAIDLMCQGVEIADVADAISRFIIDRVAAIATYLPLEREIVVAGGLAKANVLIKHLSKALNQDLSTLDKPEYVGAIGAVITNYEG